MAQVPANPSPAHSDNPIPQTSSGISFERRLWLKWSANGTIELGLIVIGLAMNLLFAPHYIGGDGSVRYQDLNSLLQNGVLDNSLYSLIGPLFSAPLWYLGTVWRGSMWWVSRFNFLVWAIGILAMYWLLRKRMDRKLLTALLLLLVAASLFPNQVQYYYGEVFTAVFVALGTLAVVFGPSIAGWVLVVIGVANTPGTLVGMGLVTLVRIWQTRRVRCVLALVATVGLIALENTLRRGGPLHTGYFNGFLTPFFFGLLSVLFSYGKGLIFFVPGIFLPFKNRLKIHVGQASNQLFTIYLMWMAFVIALVLVYSGWWAWYGGYFWGPRFYLFASFPAALVLAVRLRYPGQHLAGNLLTLLAFALSLWVAISGTIFEMGGLSACTQSYDNLIGLCAYTPQYSGLWRFLAVPLAFGKRSALVTLYGVVVFLFLGWPTLRTVASQLRLLWKDLTEAQGVRWLLRLRV